MNPDGPLASGARFSRFAVNVQGELEISRFTVTSDEVLQSSPASPYGFSQHISNRIDKLFQALVRHSSCRS